MTESTHDPVSLVLAGVLPASDDEIVSVDRVSRLVELPEGTFQNSDDSRIFSAIRAYFQRFRSPLPWRVLHDRLERESDDVQRSVAARYTTLRAIAVDDAQWDWALARARELWEINEASHVLAAAYRAVVNVEVRQRSDGSSEYFEGFKGAQALIAEGFAKIEKTSPLSAPEWRSTDGVEVLLADIGSAKRKVHFPTGIPTIDKNTSGGPALGEMWFVAAYAGSGKTTFSASVLAYQAMMSGLNVVYATGETLLEQVRRRITTRHVRDPRFHHPAGIPLQELATGELTQPQLEAFRLAATDFTEGSRDGRYGKLFLYAMDLRETFDGVLAKLDDLEREFPVHVLVVDSIDMVRSRPRGRRSHANYREQISDAIEEFASLAVSYRGGRGLCVISPYQISRSAFEEAMNNSRRYELSALSETSMAERRAAVVLSLLRDPEQPSKLSAQLLKVRHGQTADFQLDVDWKTGYMGGSGVSRAASTDSLTSSILDY